jgi:hypothetical protein
MFKPLIVSLTLCVLIGCSDPCKDQVPIPPIPESDILSYLSANIIQPSLGGKVFCSYDPINNKNRLLINKGYNGYRD